MNTTLTRLFDLSLPIIQAPMAGVSTPELAAAVSNAGGLGSVALGALTADAAVEALRATRRLTGRAVAANVFVHPAPQRNPADEAAFLTALEPLFARLGRTPPDRLAEIYRTFNDDDAMLEVLLSERPQAVSFHFGSGTPERVDALHDAGIVLLGTATTVEEARVLERSGIDLIVLQGSGAGGHHGAFFSVQPQFDAGRETDAGDRLVRRPGGGAGTDAAERENAQSLVALAALVAESAAEVHTPVVAAGGLMTGADVRQMIEAGAVGAQLGTAFIGCPETVASDAYRRCLASGGGSGVTDRISGRAARGLRNPLMAALESVPDPIPDYPLAYDAVKQLVAATADPEFAVMWAGVGAYRSRALPAAELVAELARDLAL